MILNMVPEADSGPALPAENQMWGEVPVRVVGMETLPACFFFSEKTALFDAKTF
jgi:hypothetical protein